MKPSSINTTKETRIDGFVVGFMFFLVVFTGVSLYKYNKVAVDTKIKRILNRNAHVVIISTYGPSVQGSPFYEKYIDKVVQFILDPSNKVDEIIIVGGYTVDPNVSQSQAVLQYIKDKYPEFNSVQVPVTLDECGITTWQNIKNAKKLIDQNNISAEKITIFAEESRMKKIAFFANDTFHWDSSGVIDKKKVLKEIDPLIAASQEIQLKSFEARDTEWTRFTYVNNTYLTNRDLRIITEPSGLPQEFIDEEYTKIFQEIKEFYDVTYASKSLKKKLDEWSKTAGFNTIENLVQKGCVEYKELLSK